LEKYTVKTIPTCRLIKPDGAVVVEDARTEVQVSIRKSSLENHKILPKEEGVNNALELWDKWMAFYEV
jgi:hypothetical protein